MPDIVRHMSNLHYINLTNGHYVISIPKNKNMDVTYANNITAENAMVQSGLALGLWCNFVTDPNDSTIYTKPLKTELKPRYGIAVRKDDNSKAVLHFRNWLKRKELVWK